MHAALGIDHQVGDEAEALARRQARPPAMDGIAAVAQDHGVAFVGHGGPLSCDWPATACRFQRGWSQGLAGSRPGSEFLGTILPKNSKAAPSVAPKFLRTILEKTPMPPRPRGVDNGRQGRLVFPAVLPIFSGTCRNTSHRSG